MQSVQVPQQLPQSTDHNPQSASPIAQNPGNFQIARNQSRRQRDFDQILSEKSDLVPVMRNRRTTRHRRKLLFRLLVPILSLALTVGLIYGLMVFSEMDRQSANASPPPVDAGEKVQPILPEPVGKGFEELVSDNSEKSLPVVSSPPPDLAESQNDPRQGVSTVDGGIAVLELLKKFLAMKNLKERLPHLETRQKEPALTATVLNSPLPEVLNITVDVRETNSIEQVVDYYYRVDFARENGDPNPQMILVRTRGSSPPKVVVDPFLDLFGGRFERFAAEPTSEVETFQVIVNAGAFCYDDIPKADEKFTLKILPREDVREIAKAYFGKSSNIGYMLEDETSGIAYGQAKPCTIQIRWNTADDPKRPFLEALEIKAWNWDP